MFYDRARTRYTLGKAVCAALGVLLLIATTGCGVHVNNSAALPSGAQIQVSPGNVSFGSVAVGKTASTAVTIANSGNAPLTISKLSLPGQVFWIATSLNPPVEIAAGTSYKFNLAFKPASTTAYAGQLTIQIPAASTPDLTIPISGSGTIATPAASSPQISLSASSIDFGSLATGTSQSRTLTLTSSGSAQLTISSATVSGATYSIAGASFPMTLNPNQQVSMQVVFQPTAAGAAAGQITVASNAANDPKATISLSGTGASVTAPSPQLTLSASTLNFSSVTVGASAKQTLTLSSTGTAAVTVSSAALTGSGYSISGATFPVTIAPNLQVSLQVQFKPTTAGAAAGVLTVKSNSASSATATVALSGKGSAPSNPTSPSGTALSTCADLTSSGTYYLAQDVSSAGTCFFIDADNIVLNLNGHTVTYGTGGGSAGTPGVLLADTWYTGAGSFSLAQTGSTNAHGGFEIYNGTIQSSQSAAAQSRGIWVGQSSDISPAPKVHDLTIYTTAVDANPIFGDSSLSGWQIYNNNLSFGATGSSAITSRYLLLGYAIWMADTLNAPGVIPDEIYSNHILAAPQGGIYDTNQNAHIHDNSITFSSYFTNDYCVAAVSGNGAVISNNSCAPTSGRGYDIEASNVTLSNNTATVTELKQNAEYGGCELGGADGIRIKDNYHTAGGGAPAPPSGTVVSGNVIIAQATACQANALRLSFLYPGDTATISGNSFTSTGGGSIDFAISFDQVNTAPLTFSGNTFSAHLAHIEIDYDGVIAGLIQPGQTWAGTPTYSIYDVDGGADATNALHPGLSTLIVEDNMPAKKYCGGVSLATLLLGGVTLNCP